MKKRIVALFLVMVLCCFGCSQEQRKSNEFEENFVAIDFPLYRGEFQNDIQIDFNREQMDVENDDLLKQFWIPQDNKMDEIIKNICNEVHLDYSKGQKSEDGNWQVAEKENSIVRYGDSSFMYRSNILSEKEVALTDQECIDRAEAFFKKIGVDLAQFDEAEMKYDIVESGDGKEEVVTKIVEFSRYIDNIEVEGSSKVFISFINDGQIKNVYYGLHANLKSVSVPSGNIRDIDEAIEMFEKLEGYIDIPEETTKAVVKKVECVYWENAAPGSANCTVQPVYRITGVAYSGDRYCGVFEVLEPALKIN